MTVEDLKGGGCKFSIRGSRQSGKLELTFFGSEIMGSQVVAAILSNKKPVALLFLLFSVSTTAMTIKANILGIRILFNPEVKALKDAKKAKNPELIEIDLQ